jgi:protein-tyrosine phosphatase
MGTIFGDSAHEILPGLWVGDAGSAPMAIARDFAVLNVLETGAIPGESHIPILVPLSYRSPADGVLAYRVRLDNAVKWIEENKSRHKLVHCGAGIERPPLTVAWYMCRRRVVADPDRIRRHRGRVVVDQVREIIEIHARTRPYCCGAPGTPGCDTAAAHIDHDRLSGRSIGGTSNLHLPGSVSFGSEAKYAAKSAASCSLT